MLLMIPCFNLYYSSSLKFVICHRQKRKDKVLASALLHFKKKEDDGKFFIIKLIEKKGN